MKQNKQRIIIGQAILLSTITMAFATCYAPYFAPCADSDTYSLDCATYGLLGGVYERTVGNNIDRCTGNGEAQDCQALGLTNCVYTLTHTDCDGEIAIGSITNSMSRYEAAGEFCYD